MANQSSSIAFNFPAQKKNIAQIIPVEMWSMIFKHLSWEDLVSIRLVSRRFNSMQQFICNKRRLIINFQTNCSMINRLMDRWFAKCMAQSTAIEMDIPREAIKTMNLHADAEISEIFKYFGLYCNVTQLFVVMHSFEGRKHKLLIPLLLFNLPQLEMIKFVFYKADGHIPLEQLIEKRSNLIHLRHLSIFSRCNANFMKIDYLRLSNQMPEHLSRLQELYLSGFNEKVVSKLLSIFPVITRFGLYHQDVQTLSTQLESISLEVARKLTHFEICPLEKEAQFDVEYFKCKFSFVKYLKLD